MGKIMLVVATALLGVCLLFTAGCASKERPAVAHSVFAAFDTTSSNSDEQRLEYVRKLAGLADEQMDDTWTHMMAFGIGKPDTLYKGRFNDPDDLNEAYVTYRNLPAPSKRGTYWAPFLRKIIEEAPQAEGKVSVMVFSDGECYDLAECNKLAKKMAQMDSIQVVFIGPVIYKDKIRTKIEEAFKPIENKTIIVSTTDMPQGIARFRERF